MNSSLPQGRLVSYVSGELEPEVFPEIRQAFFLGRQVGEQGVSKLEGRVERDGSRDAAAVPDGIRVGSGALAMCRPGLVGTQD